jgi:hypothetical protein
VDKVKAARIAEVASVEDADAYARRFITYEADAYDYQVLHAPHWR